MQLDANMQPTWLKEYPSHEGINKVTGIVTAASGIIFSGEYANDSIVFGNNTMYTFEYENRNYHNIFVACYETNGTVKWANRFGGSLTDQPAIVIPTENLDEYYLTGHFDSHTFTSGTDILNNLSKVSFYEVHVSPHFFWRYSQAFAARVSASDNLFNFTPPEPMPGVNEKDKNSLQIYPNPSSGNLLIRGEGISRVAVYDILGNLKQTNTATSTQQSSIYLNLNYLAKGVYMVQIEDKNGLQTRKVVLQ